MERLILHGDNAAVLPTLPRERFRLAIIDPPFNTGRSQRRMRQTVTRTDDPEARVGFFGARYAMKTRWSASYADASDDYLAFLMPRIEAALPCLTRDGSLFVHVDAREAHYVKVALDGLLGRRCFQNEIVWAYDYGGRSKRRWPEKHETIFWYSLDPERYVFRYEAIDRIPYMAPKLVTAEKAARGKVPTDVWWQTIVPTSGKEKTGYPTQKPLALVERIVRVHAEPGDSVLDFFAGSGTTGEAAARQGCGFTLVDSSRDAVAVMKRRLTPYGVSVHKAARPGRRS